MYFLLLFTIPLTIGGHEIREKNIKLRYLKIRTTSSPLYVYHLILNIVSSLDADAFQVS